MYMVMDFHGLAFAGAFWYVAGSAGLGATYKSNRDEFTKYSIIPRMLVLKTEEYRSLEVCHSSSS